MIHKIKLEKFTAFNKLELTFSPSINVLIGENGTGKTHLLKAGYALSTSNPASVSREPSEVLTEKLIGVFKPDEDRLGELFRKGPSDYAKLSIEFQEFKGNSTISTSFYPTSKKLKVDREAECRLYSKSPVFIPTKEVLSFYSGFVGLYERFKLPFDMTYRDICLALSSVEARQDALEERAKWAMAAIEEKCGGKFVFKGESISFKKSTKEELSVNLIAEGFRKLGAIYRLLETEAISPRKSGTLFIDEPEANLNPRLMKLLVEILLELARKGQQIILATHDYVLLKELDLQMRESDQVLFHALYLNKESNEICVESTRDYLKIQPNAIDDTFADLIDREITRSMGDLGK